MREIGFVVQLCVAKQKEGGEGAEKSSMTICYFDRSDSLLKKAPIENTNNLDGFLCIFILHMKPLIFVERLYGCSMSIRNNLHPMYIFASDWPHTFCVL